MIVNSKDILNKARENNYAVPQFNVNNLEWAKYILEECQNLKMPVILGVSEGAIKYMGGFKTVTYMILGLMVDLGMTSPVVLHLDHGTKEGCIKAINAGFSSVMYDGSKLSLEENIAETKEIVALAKTKNITVEAEIGHIGGIEDGISGDASCTNLNDAKKLVETGIDSLAPAIGSAHGIYKGEPNLNFELLEELKNNIKIPLVLHGGTGIADQILRGTVTSGISKINFNTELQLAWNESVRAFITNNPDVYDPRKIISSGEKAIKKVVRDKIILLKMDYNE